MVVLKNNADYDAILFCAGKNYIWTKGRISLSLFGILVSAATGVPVIVPAGPEWIAIALVDGRSGDLIWFDYRPMPGDLRKAEVVEKLVKKIFKSLTENPKKQKL